MVLQAFYHLLEKSTVRRFVIIGALAGSNTMVAKLGPFYIGPYSVSKAAVNSFIVEAHQELYTKGFMFCSINPGNVETDLFSNYKLSLETLGHKLPEDTESPELSPVFSAKESSAKLVRTILNLTLDKSGCFINYDGSIIPW
ncbi:hypothetical protein V1511DRAFT_503897 [Dipodascopsis uninucleata]